MIVGYFCSGGHTEINGIEPFLRKINPDIKWKRCLPPCGKPVPVLTTRGETIFRRGFSEEYECYNGLTGEKLADEMFTVIRDYGKYLGCDMYILVDDFDCRFKSKECSVEDWIANQRKRAEKEFGISIDFDVLFASPEVEAWFLADWENSFNKEYRRYSTDVPYTLREVLKRDSYLSKYWDDIEKYGEDIEQYSKEYKLSKKIQDAFEGGALNDIFKKHSITRCSYSKRIEGAEMLRQIRPDEVSKMCRHYFAPFYRKYRAYKHT